jgi:hypothetical protein
MNSSKVASRPIENGLSITSLAGYVAGCAGKRKIAIIKALPTAIT